jgi:hypothetical protein
MATTARRRKPNTVTKVWDIAKDLDYGQKMQLITMLISSVRTTDDSKPKRKLDANDYAGIWDDGHFMPAEDINKAIRDARHVKSGRHEFWDEFLNEP